MKKLTVKILATLASFMMVLTSCYHDHEPEADFRASTVTAEPYEKIFFTNTSTYSNVYEWDFGDGWYFDGRNAEHVYENPGTYRVTLTVFEEGYAVSHASITIRIVEPVTSLVIEVLEFHDEYPVSDASVLLFNNLNDWENETNFLVEGFTNKDGILEFVDLAPKRYYLDVWEANHHNYWLAEEDIGFIETLPLIRGEVNHFTAWVDFVPHDSQSRKNSKTESATTRKNQLKVMKIERKASEKQKSVKE